MTRRFILAQLLVAALFLGCLPFVDPLACSRRATAQSAPGSGIGLRAILFHRAAPGANTAIVTKDPNNNTIAGLTALSGVGAFRITVQLATSSVLNVSASDGTTTTKMHLNGGSALAAGALYTFSFGVCNRVPRQDQNATPTALVWNLEVETDSVVDLLQVDEINNGVL